MLSDIKKGGIWKVQCIASFARSMGDRLSEHYNPISTHGHSWYHFAQVRRIITHSWSMESLYFLSKDNYLSTTYRVAVINEQTIMDQAIYSASLCKHRCLATVTIRNKVWNKINCLPVVRFTQRTLEAILNFDVVRLMLHISMPRGTVILHTLSLIKYRLVNSCHLTPRAKSLNIILSELIICAKCNSLC